MNIAVFGAHGRVGSALCKLAQPQHNVLPIDKNGPAKTDVAVDVAIDFSLPQATEQVCEFCKTHRCPLVTGVTGRNAQQQAILDNLKHSVAVVESENFSRGIALLKRLCEIAAQENWDCEIVETHRKGKKDSPGGTAKMLAATVAQHGTRIVSVHSLRCGSNFGKHEVVFATQGESICLIHQAENVEIFAIGALKAAERLVISS